MPWTAADAEGHTKKADTAAKRKRWAEVANDRLAACLKDGGSQGDCEASAIRQANAVVGKMEEAEMNEYSSSLTLEVDGERVTVAEMVEAWRELREAKMKTVDGKPRPASDFLVVEDSDKPSTWHLPVKRNGKPDHGLMGGAWAALHQGYRGNKYEGPKKAEAIRKLKVLYKSEDMEMPSEKSEADVAEYEINGSTIREVLMYLLDMWQGAQTQEEQEMSEVELSESASGHAVAIAEDNTPAGSEARAPLLLDMALIKPGWGNSQDKHYYPAEILKRDAGVFAGAKMYATDHRQDEKSVRTEVATVKEMVGFTVEGEPIGRAAIHDPGFAEATRNREKLGTLGTLECSILAKGRAKKGEIDGEKANIVEAITEAYSVDFVTKAGAGGHALAIITESEKGDATMSDEREGQETQESQEASPAEALDPVRDGAAEEVTLQEGDGETQEAQLLSESDVASILDETKLPQAAKERLTAGEYPDEEALQDAVAAEVRYVKTLTGSGQPFAGGNGTAPPAESAEEREKRRTERFNRIMREIGAKEV